MEEEIQSASFRFSPVSNTDQTDSPASKGTISRIVGVCASSEDEIDLGNGGEYSLREENVLQSKYFIRGTDLASVVIEWNDVQATTVAVEGSFTDGVQEKLTKKWVCVFYVFGVHFMISRPKCVGGVVCCTD